MSTPACKENSARTGGTVRLSFQSLQSRRNRLQRKELLPRPWAHRDAVGDRVAEQIIQRTGLGICGEPRASNEVASQWILRGVNQHTL
jgi:hypothetical protein